MVAKSNGPSRNLDPVIAQVLESGKATLFELKTVYSMEDLFNMWEVTYTTIYNKWLAHERELQSQRLRRK